MFKILSNKELNYVTKQKVEGKKIAEEQSLSNDSVIKNNAADAYLDSLLDKDIPTCTSLSNLWLHRVPISGSANSNLCLKLINTFNKIEKIDGAWYQCNKIVKDYELSGIAQLLIEATTSKLKVSWQRNIAKRQNLDPSAH